MEFKDIKVEKPNQGDEIIGITTVGRMNGTYLKNDIFVTNKGSLFNFTKWKLQEKKK